MNEIQKYIAAHEPKMMDDLFSLIRIPSISALPEHHDDMLACAERWAQLLLEAGVDEALVMPSQGNPVVFAQKIVNPDAKTVLIYAHYDVMPAEPLELWKSEPFEPEIRDGHIWARGADDDKGQSFIQVKAFEYLVKNGLLKNNVKFIFEGEEEIGSPSLEAFCEEHKELLKADVILVSDTSMLGAELPSLTTGLRGLAYWEIEVTGPNRDLHSGHFGGAVANPINVLCQIISKITDANGRITVPGFYDDVEEVPQTEREMIAHIPFDEKKYKEAIGVKELFGEKGYSTLEHLNKTYLLSELSEEDRRALAAVNIVLPDLTAGSTEGVIDFAGVTSGMLTHDGGQDTDNIIAVRVKANDRWSDAGMYTIRTVKPVFKVGYYPGNVWTKEFTLNTLTADSVKTGNLDKFTDIAYEFSADGNSWEAMPGDLRKAGLSPGTSYYVRAKYRGEVPGEKVEVKTYPQTMLENGSLECT